MKKSKSLYHGHRFPAGVISCAVRWYFRFQLSLRDIEELLLERGVVVSYKTIRCWCDKFGVSLAHRVKAARRRPGNTWHLDEMFVTLRGEPYLLWRAVDEHGAELDILMQKRRDKADRSEAGKVLRMLPLKYPDQFSPPIPMPSPEEVRIFRVTPTVISVLDYSKGFGHTDLVTC